MLKHGPRADKTTKHLFVSFRASQLGQRGTAFQRSIRPGRSPLTVSTVTQSGQYGCGQSSIKW
jgi:hypothetical protein